jgi:alkylated DNA repair dioxygenase AlkB
MRHFELGDGSSLDLYESWLPEAKATALFSSLLAQAQWEQKAIRIAGREVMQPRRTAWYGDAEAVYTYSGLRNVPLPWLPTLLDLRARLSAEMGVFFNGALLNHYRDGNDSMGFHADDEAELGPNPVVASISLGETRRFLLRHVKNKNARLDLDLPHGSLLLMGGTLQHDFRHALPKQADKGARINITFRRVVGVAVARSGSRAR